MLAQRSKELLSRYRSGDAVGEECPLKTALAGRFTRKNREGWERRLKELPKPSATVSENLNQAQAEAILST